MIRQRCSLVVPRGGGSKQRIQVDLGVLPAVTRIVRACQVFRLPFPCEIRASLARSYVGICIHNGHKKIIRLRPCIGHEMRESLEDALDTQAHEVAHLGIFEHGEEHTRLQNSILAMWKKEGLE